MIVINLLLLPLLTIILAQLRLVVVVREVMKEVFSLLKSETCNKSNECCLTAYTYKEEFVDKGGKGRAAELINDLNMVTYAEYRCYKLITLSIYLQVENIVNECTKMMSVIVIYNTRPP